MPRIETDAQAWAWLVKWQRSASGRDVAIGLDTASDGRRAVTVYLFRIVNCTAESKSSGLADTLAAAVRKVMAAKWE